MFFVKLASWSPVLISQFYSDFVVADRIGVLENRFETNRVEVAAMSHLLAIGLCFLPAIMWLTNCVTVYGDDASFRITTKRYNDKVEVKVKEGKAHFSVQSPFGISQAVFERSGNRWPTTVMLRLHLKGLEKVKVTNGRITLEGAVSSQDGKVRLWKDGKEDSPLDSKHPYWMKIRLVGQDGNRVITIPLKDGYFEMQLPKALFEDNPKSITVNWIDFYR